MAAILLVAAFLSFASAQGPSDAADSVRSDTFDAIHVTAQLELKRATRREAPLVGIEAEA